MIVVDGQIGVVSGAAPIYSNSTVQRDWISVEDDVDYFAAHVIPAGSDLYSSRLAGVSRIAWLTGSIYCLCFLGNLILLRGVLPVPAPLSFSFVVAVQSPNVMGTPTPFYKRSPSSSTLPLSLSYSLIGSKIILKALLSNPTVFIRYTLLTFADQQSR